MTVSERINQIGESPTMKVAAKAKKMRSEGLNVIDLSVGEPDFPTPQNIKDAAIQAINENKTKYTVNPGVPELRQAIVDKFKRDNNLEYSVNDVIVSSGAKQSLFNVMQTLVYTEDEVIIPAPYWVSYPHMVTLAHGKSVIVETKEENGFKLTPEELEKAITQKTKAIILCNPSNPTGSAYTKEELEALAEILLKHEIYIVADEIYEKLVYGSHKHVSIASLSEEIKNRTVTINGVSKAYSMTGWRIGFTVGPEAVIKGINKIQSHSTSNACSISQAATIEALNGPQFEVERMRLAFDERREFLWKALNEIEGFSCRKPEGAFYLFPNIKQFIGKQTDVLKINNSYDFAMFLLYEAKIAAVPGSSFGAEGYLRFSYANSLENIKEAVERIKEAVSKLK